MAAQPSSMLASRYQAFRSLPLTRRPEGITTLGTMVDDDGSTLYENDEGLLLITIIRLNDVAALERYLATNTRNCLGPGGFYTEDPFWNAVAYGSTDALHVLLEHWDAADPSTYTNVPGPDERKHTLLSVACGSAHIETARFLLDGPWKATYGDIYKKDAWGSTVLLAAAASFYSSRYPVDRASKDNNSVQNYLACAEEVMKLLLDHGACVQDVIFEAHEPQQPLETVLGSAISRASPALVKRLIDQGADVYAKMTCDPINEGDNVKDVTAFHIGSLYSNVQGIQVLLDYARGTRGVDIVQQADSHGRLPLHYTAWGLDNNLHMLEAEETVLPVTATMKLLLQTNPSTINAQDKKGDTALHIAVRTYGRYGNKYVAIPKLLCEHGADASIRGRRGETALHGLGFRVLDSEPVHPSLIDLLLDHGASVDDTDQDGNTPLHFAAKNLGHIKSAQHLLSRGANVSAKDRQGNTPLHQAARGTLGLFFAPMKPRKEPFTTDEQVKAQDEMMAVLLDRVSRETADALMDQPNADGKTPRQICREWRNKWQESEDTRNKRAARQNGGRGRGKGGRGD